MYIDTVSSITNWQDNASVWLPPFNVDHGSACIDVSDAVGTNATTPHDANHQPKPHPMNSKYQFDSSQFMGPDTKDAINSTINSACTGCTLFLQLNDTENHQYQLRCNHYPVQRASMYKFSDPMRLTKDNVVPITNKRSQSHSQSAFRRMCNPKMRSCPRVADVVGCREHTKVNKNKRGGSHRARDKKDAT